MRRIAQVVGLLVVLSFAVLGQRVWVRAQAVSLVISEYLGSVIAGNYDAAEALLTGTARNAFRQTRAGLERVETASLGGFDISFETLGPAVTVANVRVHTSQVASDGVFLDVEMVRFHLLNTASEGWRIYSYEPMPMALSSWQMPALPSWRSHTNLLNVAQSYVTTTVSGDYANALRYLGGQARVDAETTLAQLNKVQLGVALGNYDARVLQASTKGVWVEATYDVVMEGQEARTVTTLLELQPVSDSWLVVKVSNL